MSSKCTKLTRQSQMLLDLVSPDVSMSKIEEITRDEDDEVLEQDAMTQRLNDKIKGKISRLKK